MSQKTTSKSRPTYRLTKYSILWIVAAIVLIPYEILMVIQGKDGGPLTHVVKWAYGDQGSLRWWLLGWANTGFLFWLMPHFLFEDWGAVHLAALVVLGLLVGIAGYFLTH
jgi:hypothetical protein